MAPDRAGGPRRRRREGRGAASPRPPAPAPPASSTATAKTGLDKPELTVAFKYDEGKEERVTFARAGGSALRGARRQPGRRQGRRRGRSTASSKRSRTSNSCARLRAPFVRRCWLAARSRRPACAATQPAARPSPRQAVRAAVRELRADLARVFGAPDHGSRRLGRRRPVARHRRASVRAERRQADDAGVQHEDPDAGGRRRGARLGLSVHHDARDARHRSRTACCAAI